MTMDKKTEILASLTKIIDGFGGESEEDLLHLINTRLGTFLSQNLTRMKDRRNLTQELEETVSKVYEQEGSRFFYNHAINAYYEVIDNDRFVLQHSDKILIKLKEYIPYTMYRSRYAILKALKRKLKGNNILSWIPPYCVVRSYLDLIDKIFLDRNSSYHFMYLIGGVILRRETDLGTDTTHLWYGQHIDEVIKFLEQALYDVFRITTSFFSSIRKEYQSKLLFSRLRYLFFPDTPMSDTIKSLHENIECFFMACVSIYHNYPTALFLEGDSIINVFRKYENKENIFRDYHESSVSVESQPIGFLLFEEICEDLNDFIHFKGLPPNLFSHTELRVLINANFDSVRNPHQTFFIGRLSIVSHYDNVLEFTATHPMPQESSDDQRYLDYVNWLKDKKNDHNYCEVKQFSFFIQNAKSIKQS